MSKASEIKRIVAIIFVVVLAIEFVKNRSYAEVNKLTYYLLQSFNKSDAAIGIETIEKDFCESLINQSNLIDLNGLFAKKLGIKGYYKDQGVCINDEGYIVSAYDYTSTDYEYEQTIAFKDYLDSIGVNLLYVNEPTKYIEDDVFINEFGIDTYSNRNADLFLKRIREAGVNTIDLRENISEEGININDLFYRTDHHWTTPAGLWATKIISEGLNEYCGYNIDTDIFDLGNFNITSWENCWLGEQGRLVGKTYVGLDDYTELKPNFETSYTFENYDGTTFDGPFDFFVNEEVYNLENDVYDNKSWHYSYRKFDSLNNNVETGKVLFIGDSFDHVTVPFLSLGVREVDFLILRDCDADFDLREHILENGYDSVIIGYAQLFIGAHDDIDSTNYRMFTFE